MANYLTHDGSGNRITQNKVEIGDFIINMDRDETPLYTALASRQISDINPKVLEDSYDSFDSGNAFAQDAVAPDASDTSRSAITNWTQILMKTAEVTDTQNQVDQHGLSSELVYEEGKKATEWKLDLEQFVVSDQSSQEPTSANGNVGKMAGMSSIITTTTTSVSSFSASNFDSNVGACVAAGGNPTVAYMAKAQKVASAAWTDNLTHESDDPRGRINNVVYYETSLGQVVRFKYHHKMPVDISSNAAHVLCLDMETWELLPFIPVFRADLPYQGAGPASLIKGEYSILCHAESANMQFY